MAIGPETQAVLTRLDTATTAVATRITEILAGMDLSDEEQAAFDVVIENLNALGHNPENPTPALGAKAGSKAPLKDRL